MTNDGGAGPIGESNDLEGGPGPISGMMPTGVLVAWLMMINLPLLKDIVI